MILDKKIALSKNKVLPWSEVLGTFDILVLLKSLPSVDVDGHICLLGTSVVQITNSLGTRIFE